MGDLDFIENRETIEPSEFNTDPLPAGVYKAYIEESLVSPTKSSDGVKFAGTYVVQEPKEFAGRKVFLNLLLKHSNPKAQEIGLGKMSALSRACGLTTIPNDSMKLRNKPHLITVKVTPASEKYSAGNEITKWVSSTGEKAESGVRKAQAAPSKPEDGDDIPF